MEPWLNGGQVEYWCERCACEDKNRSVGLETKKVEPKSDSTNFKATQGMAFESQPLDFAKGLGLKPLFPRKSNAAIETLYRSFFHHYGVALF